jgi:hypothetical protein
MTDCIVYVCLVRGDDRLTVGVRFDCRPGTPGCLSVAPEDCYPAEGPEVEIRDIYWPAGYAGQHELTDEEERRIRPALVRHAEERARWERP